MKCTSLINVRNEKDVIVKACKPCVQAANAKGESRPRSMSTSSERSSSGCPTPTPPPSTAACQCSPDVLSQLLAKLDKLDTLDALSVTVNSIDSKVNTVAESLHSLQNEVREVRDMAASLNLRLDSSEAELKQLQLQQAALRTDCDGLQQVVDTLRTSTHSGSLGSCSSSDHQSQLAEVDALAKQVRQLATQQQVIAHSSEIVIGGLPIDCFKDMKLAAYAVISTVYSETSPDDILAVRPLRPISSANEQAAASTSTSAVRVDSSATETSATTAPTSLATLSQLSIPKKAVPILVTLSSSTLARAVISAKIRRKKLHTSQLITELVKSAGLKGVLSPSLININEFLPRDVHQLKLRVLAKAKDKSHEFLTFVRNGCIYVRRKKEDTPVLISTDDDLKDFLEILCPTVNLTATVG